MKLMDAIKQIFGFILMILFCPFRLIYKIASHISDNYWYAYIAMFCGFIVVANFFIGGYKSGMSFEEWKTVTFDIWRIILHFLGTIFSIAIIGAGLEMLCNLIMFILHPFSSIYEFGHSLSKCESKKSKIGHLSTMPLQKSYTQRPTSNRPVQNRTLQNRPSQNIPVQGSTENQTFSFNITKEDIENSEVVF